MASDMQPHAVRNTVNLGSDFGNERMTAWVAYLRLPCGSPYLVSGLPQPTRAAALAEARRKVADWSMAKS